MIASGTVSIAVDLDPKDRERLEAVSELERRLAMLEARAAAAVPSKTAEAVYLSPKNFAKRWDVSERTAREWLAEGLPQVPCGAVMVRIPVFDGDAWVRARRDSPTAKNE